MALVMAAAGLYGVIAYTVERRTREVGIRVALGADARSVLTLVVAQGLRLVAAGMGIGLVLAMLALVRCEAWCSTSRQPTRSRMPA